MRTAKYFAVYLNLRLININSYLKISEFEDSPQVGKELININS